MNLNWTFITPHYRGLKPISLTAVSHLMRKCAAPGRLVPASVGRGTAADARETIVAVYRGSWSAWL